MSSALTVSETGRRSPRMAQVVDAFEDDEVLHVGLGQHVAVEPRQRIHAETGVVRRVVQNAIAADAGIEDADSWSMHFQQTRRQHVRPPVVAVHRGVRAIGDRIAECDQRRGRFGVENLYAAEKHPGGDFDRIGEGRGRGLVARRNIRSLLRGVMNPRARCCPRNEDADRQIPRDRGASVSPDR